MVVHQFHIAGNGKSILITVAAFEFRVAALSLAEGLVGFSQILQDMSHRLEAVVLQPGGVRMVTQGGEFKPHAEKCEIELRLFRSNLVILPAAIVPVLLPFQSQKVVPDKAAGSCCVPASWWATAGVPGNRRKRTPR